MSFSFFCVETDDCNYMGVFLTPLLYSIVLLDHSMAASTGFVTMALKYNYAFFFFIWVSLETWGFFSFYFQMSFKIFPLSSLKNVMII